MSQLLSIKTNRRGFEDYRVARNLLFTPSICT